MSGARLAFAADVRIIRGMRRLSFGLVLAVSFLSAPGSVEATGASWTTITREKGILVSTRVEDGRQFPSFRGIGRVDASIWEILAILEDADVHHTWMHDCSDSRLVEQVADDRQIVYNRTDAPWPVADRDIVLHSTYEPTRDGKQLWARFRQTTHASIPVIEGVVRMPTLEGHYHLVAIDDSHALVEYRVNADPGGALPDWLVEQSTKDLPLHTLLNLREQVKAKRGAYDLSRYGR
jgi:hypothetical protein